MLAVVDLDVDSLGDALESLQTVLIPWLQQRSSLPLNEEEAEREYVKLALEVIARYDPTLDEAKQTYFVYRLVPVLRELAETPALSDVVQAMANGYVPLPEQAESVTARSTEQRTQGSARQPAQPTGRLPDLPTGQPLRERPRVRYDAGRKPGEPEEGASPESLTRRAST